MLLVSTHDETLSRSSCRKFARRPNFASEVYI